MSYHVALFFLPLFSSKLNSSSYFITTFLSFQCSFYCNPSHKVITFIQTSKLVVQYSIQLHTMSHFLCVDIAVTEYAYKTPINIQKISFKNFFHAREVNKKLWSIYFNGHAHHVASIMRKGPVCMYLPPPSHSLTLCLCCYCTSQQQR